MASSTTTRKPANGELEGATVDDPTGADRTADVVLGAAVIAMGLLAGLFYAFDVAVMPALTAADDRTLVDAMQQMIDKIENPALFLTLLGVRRSPRSPSFRRVAPARPRPQAGSSPASPSTRCRSSSPSQSTSRSTMT
jgi:hypothetical protein